VAVAPVSKSSPDGVDVAMRNRTAGNGLDVVLDVRRRRDTPVWNVRIVSCVPGSPIDWGR